MRVKPSRKPYFSQDHSSWAVPLTLGVIALVDAADVPMLSQHNWFAYRNRYTFYAVRNVRLPDGGRRYLPMHRAILAPPDGMEVDHREHRPIDERLIDNRRSNLRICSNRQNQWNMRPQVGGTSRWKGVRFHRATGKWEARIGVYGKSKHLGLFTDELSAAAAYDAAALKYFGEFAHTNEP